MALNPLSARDKQKGLLRTDIVQTLTEPQKANVRQTIGAPPDTRAVNTPAEGGLTGGGNMTANRALSVAGRLLSLFNIGPAVRGLLVTTTGGATAAVSIGVGNGLTGQNLTGTTFAGEPANPTVAMGTPSPITRTSTNSTTVNSHSHELSQDAFRDMLANYMGVNQQASLMFASYTGPDRLYGEVVNGSTLRPSSDGGVQPASGITGQWRCLGYGRGGFSTLWLKISN